MNKQRLIASSAILLTLFLVGALLMGFEMLGNRYLNPYFGSGIDTWACLISVVLLAMMIGYLGGGYIVDRLPRADLLAFSSILAGVSILVVPPLADPVLQTLVETIGDGFWAILISATALTFIPVLLLSACSPFAVRLLLDDLSLSGRITGLVYSISTLGNVVGTLGTTYLLIPYFGIRNITLGFGLLLIFIGLVFWLLRKKIIARLDTGPLPSVVCAVVVFLVVSSSAFAGSTVKRSPAFYPEGPVWQSGVLLVAEMGADRILRLNENERTVFWSQKGCGPTAIARFRDDSFAVLCHRARKVVIISQTGDIVSEIARTPSGEQFNNPNDAIADGDGGIFFSDPGLFSVRAPAIGHVYHLSSKGSLRSIAQGLRYPNGVAYRPESRTLLVAEHLRKRVLELSLDKQQNVVSSRVLLDLKPLLKSWFVGYPEAGPDGIELDGEDVFVAVYGAGRVILVRPQQRHIIKIPIPYVTNVAVSPNSIAIVGVFNNRTPPYKGSIAIWQRRAFEEKLRQNATISFQ